MPFTNTCSSSIMKTNIIFQKKILQQKKKITANLRKNTNNYLYKYNCSKNKT